MPAGQSAGKQHPTAPTNDGTIVTESFGDHSQPTTLPCRRGRVAPFLGNATCADNDSCREQRRVRALVLRRPAPASSSAAVLAVRPVGALRPNATDGRRDSPSMMSSTILRAAHPGWRTAAHARQSIHDASQRARGSARWCARQRRTRTAACSIRRWPASAQTQSRSNGDNSSAAQPNKRIAQTTS